MACDHIAISFPVRRGSRLCRRLLAHCASSSLTRATSAWRIPVRRRRWLKHLRLGLWRKTLDRPMSALRSRFRSSDKIEMAVSSRELRSFRHILRRRLSERFDCAYRGTPRSEWTDGFVVATCRMLRHSNRIIVWPEYFPTLSRLAIPHSNSTRAHVGRLKRQIRDPPDCRGEIQMNAKLTLSGISDNRSACAVRTSGHISRCSVVFRNWR